MSLFKVYPPSVGVDAPQISARIFSHIKTMRTKTIYLAAIFLTATVSFSQGRLRPPANVGCDRNNLTSYTGVLKKFSRDKAQARLTIQTDDATTETVSVPVEKIAGHSPKTGERLTAWVCTSGAVTIEWESSPLPR